MKINLSSTGSLIILLTMVGVYHAKADSTIRIHAGGAAYTDSSGNVWSADANYKGGLTYSTDQPISNTSDTALYQTERYGNMKYNLSVPNGNYTVILKFAEIYWKTTGSRIFNVSMNGVQVLSNFDIFAAAGGAQKAIDKSFPITVSGGVISITFSGIIDNAKIDAIQIVPLESSSNPSASPALFRIHAGGEEYVDSNGNIWSADANYAGGQTYSTQQPVSNTSDATLYESERYGNLAYSFGVPNGSYNVVLKFAEIYWDSPGIRVFNVSINGTPVLANFDIFSAAGGQYKALDKTFPVTVTGGTITIAFTSVLENPKIGAIEIDQADTQQPISGGSGTGVPATSANTFLNSLGVNTHISQGYDQSIYIAPIQYLGIRNIRDQAVNLYNTYLLHQATGVLADISVGCEQTEANADNVLPYIAKYLGSTGSLLALEGPNEPNNWPVTYQGQVGGGFCATCTWVPVASCQRDLYSAIKSSASLKQYPVFSVSLGGAETDNVGLQFLTIPSGTDSVMPAGTQYGDYANQHNYVSSNKNMYEDNQAWIAADTQQNTFPGDNLYNEYGSTFNKHYAGYSATGLLNLPRVTTETGWDSVGNPGGESVQGKVLTNTYLANFKRGSTYTFIYELIDGEGGGATQGLFHSDYTPKPVADYVHNLTTILADRGTLSSPGAVNYSISGQPATVHDLLLQKSDGTFELVIWDERVSASDSITVNLGSSIAAINIYDITAGSTPIKTINNSSSVNLTLSDHAMVLEFK